MSQLPTAPVTLLYTDIEVSTLLLQQPGAHLASVLIEYRDLLRTAFSEYHGYEFDTQGDGCFGVFFCACQRGYSGNPGKRKISASDLHPLLFLRRYMTTWSHGSSIR